MSDTPELSIDGAYDQALASLQDGSNGQQPPAGSNEPSKPVVSDGQPAPKEAPKAPNEAAKPDDKQGTPKGDQKPKEPIIDPDNGKYDGEYTPERFNGLMSSWQKDRAAAKAIPDLQRQIAELQQQINDPKSQPANGEDVELPPEIANADPETQEGFKLMYKAMQGTISKSEQTILAKLMDHVNKPLKEQNEIATQVSQEVEELSVELGASFSDNVKDIMKYAADNQYPLGTLRQAHLAWQKDQKIAELEKKSKVGKEILDDIDADKAKDAEIPNGNANRSGVFPQWDEKRDGNKTIADAFEDVKRML